MEAFLRPVDKKWTCIIKILHKHFSSVISWWCSY